MVSTRRRAPTAAITNRSRKCRTSAFTNSLMSTPPSASRATKRNAPATSRSSTSSAAWKSSSASTSPSRPSTSSSVMAPPPKEASCSRVVIASRIPPSAWRPMSVSAPSATFTPSASAIVRRRLTMSSTERRWKSKRWQREWIVSGTLCGCVVHRMKTVWLGGSSMVLRSALNAEAESMWTSSMM